MSACRHRDADGPHRRMDESIHGFECRPEFAEIKFPHICNDRNRDLPDTFVMQCEREMMAVNYLVTSVGPQNNGNAVCL
jgi:hypothetical protein